MCAMKTSTNSESEENLQESRSRRGGSPVSPRNLINLSLKRVGLVLLSAIISLSLLEITGQIGFRLVKGQWLFWESPLRTSDFMSAHPWLVASPQPGMHGEYDGIRITHNQYGTRGAPFQIRKPAGVTRILTLGGSSTYCTGVSDEDTWPVRLQERLGEGFEVINFGVLGFTTAEHVIQTALMISDLTPDIIIYYEGWNDARNTHVQHLRPDYADFHGRSEYFNHALYEFAGFNRSVLMLAAKKGMRWVRNPYGFEAPVGTADKFQALPDHRALGIYERNLKLLGAIARELGALPVFVPQIMNYEILDRDTPYSWLPFVRDRDLKAVVGSYNLRMQEIAGVKKIPFVRDVLEVDYEIADFLPKDPGHFSPSGNRKFAGQLAGFIEREIRLR
jgi:lysophospholipase L1-like esterase